MVPNSILVVVCTEVEQITQVVNGGTISIGGGHFNQRYRSWLEDRLKFPRILLTVSKTAALGLAALALEIKLDYEVVVPSYMYLSTANALLRGVALVYVGADLQTINIYTIKRVRGDLSLPPQVVIPVHYSDVPRSMNAIRDDFGDQKYICVAEDNYGTGTGFVIQGRKDSGKYWTDGVHHTTKNVTTGSAGGAILFNYRNLIDHVKNI